MKLLTPDPQISPRILQKSLLHSSSSTFRAESYDLVLLDIMLPGVDGYVLLEEIKPAGTPVIFLTAKGAVEDRIRGLKAGADQNQGKVQVCQSR